MILLTKWNLEYILDSSGLVRKMLMSSDIDDEQQGRRRNTLMWGESRRGPNRLSKARRAEVGALGS